jgi:energy-coupling factor transport system ATP-binding protein
MEEIDTTISKSSKLVSKNVLNSDRKNPGYENNPASGLLVRTEDLFYIYDDGTAALNGVNLGISSGEFVAILGCNGAGKSTLAQVMTGLLKPTRGKMYIDSRDITKCSAAEIAETIGYTFQNPENQLFCDTVRDEVAFGPRQLRLVEKDVDERVGDALRVMGLTRLEDRYPQALSRGQRLRVAIASVLSMKPKVLILDEPMAAQDMNQIASLMRHLELLNSKGLAVVMITHDINVTARYVSRVVLMAKGQIIADGKPREVLSNEELLVRSGLSLPTAVSLSKYMGLPPMISIDELSQALWGV